MLERKRSAEQTADVDALRTAMHQCFSAIHVNQDGEVYACLPRLDHVTEREGKPARTWREMHMGAKIAFPTRSTTQQGTFVW